MKNPLNKRFIRELKEEAGKYLVIFILMAFSIALTAGYIVADGSMIKAYNDSFEKFNNYFKIVAIFLKYTVQNDYLLN